jgi:ribosome biogenesis protein UTP30
MFAGKPFAAQVKKAVHALFAYQQKFEEGSSSLVQDDAAVYIQIAMMTTPPKDKVKPYMIPLPHSMYKGGDKEVCLFTKDPQATFEGWLEQSPVSGIARVMGCNELRRNYGQYKDKRELMGEFDLFMCDERILSVLPPLLGGKFFGRNKHPVPVDIKTQGRMAANLAKVRDCAFVYIPKGGQLAIKAAYYSQGVNATVKNILAILAHANKFVPKGERNVQAVFIKTQKSAALPVFQTLPTHDSVNEEPAETETETEVAETKADQKKAEKKTKKTKKSASSRPLLAAAAKQATSVVKTSSSSPAPASTPSSKSKKKPSSSTTPAVKRKKPARASKPEPKAEEEEEEAPIVSPRRTRSTPYKAKRPKR